MEKAERHAKLKKLWQKRSPSDIAEELGVSLRTIQRDARELGLPVYHERTIDHDIAAMRTEQDLRRERSTSRKLKGRVDVLSRELEAALRIKSERGLRRVTSVDSGDSEAVAVAVASDWHIEEVVEGYQVNDLNVFNAQVCEERVGRFFRHVVKLVKKEQRSASIKTLVLALLGDFISGSIHDELVEGNRLLPVDAVIEVQRHIGGGIQYILDNTDVDLVIPCHSGNHGRMTKKVHVSTEAGNSLERLMYHSLAGMFRGNKRVKFIVSEGYHSYLELFDNFTIRFHHGHSVRYNGGVGGLTIPLNKAIAQWNKGRHADLDVCGHYHTFLDGGNFVVNGSLIGFNAFALSIKASPEPPVQAFFLVDRDHGKTVVCPVILTQDR